MNERLRHWAFPLLGCLVLAAAAPTLAAVRWGVDLSSLPRVEAAGGQWWRDGQPVDALAAAAHGGWSLLRLRLWHSPVEAGAGETAMLALAERARAAGMDLLLDFHYSDTWADPGQQTPPAAWQGLPVAMLADSVRLYTRRVLEHFAAAGVAPLAVQLGNEIDGGLLWPTGQVNGELDTPTQWSALRTLLSAASQGVEEAFPDPTTRPRRIIHLSQSGWWVGCRRFLDSLSVNGGPSFEIAGFSYYPWWHGAPTLLQQTLDGAATRYGKAVWIVETAYPFSLGWNDNTFNLVGEAGQLVPGYPASPSGQEAWLAMLRQRLVAVPAERGEALLMWEPAWISAPSLGSSVENLCLFDFAGAALSALDLPASLDLRPPRLRATALPGALRLDWDPVPGARRYRIEGASGFDGPWSPLQEVESGPLEFPASPPGARYRVLGLGD